MTDPQALTWPIPVRLEPKPWMTAAPTLAVTAALERVGGPGCARFVGGCVRDLLLCRERADLDIDIATLLTPPDVIAALERAGLKAVPTGVEHGTVTAVAEGRPYEITTLRRDVQTDGRRAVVAFSTDWGEDAARRDFRMNALYLDLEGRLYDPTGGGVEDALAGRIVFVGDPATRIREDYLRVLRYFRFLAGYGRGEPDAAATAACAALKDGLSGLSGERVSKELLKLLAAADPRPSVALMASTGVLGVVLPDVVALPRFDALVAIEGAGDADPGLRLAALLPDDVSAAGRAAERLRLPKALRDRLRAACSDALAITAQMSPQGARAAIYRLGAQVFQDRARLAWAREVASERAEPAYWRALAALGEGWRPPPFPITGAQIKAVGVPEGPQVGRVRREIEAWWIARDFTADQAAASDYLAERAAIFGKAAD